MKLIIKNQEILLSDWVAHIDPKMYGGRTYRKYVENLDNSFIELFLTSNGMRTESSFYYYRPYFHGILRQLELIYYRMYPDPTKYSSIYFKNAQDHIDKFIHQFNYLKAFI